jgi:hypothetical protein
MKPARKSYVNNMKTTCKQHGSGIKTTISNMETTWAEHANNMESSMKNNRKTTCRSAIP